jgi:ribonucleoside-diphosphate reductase alpha chain
VLDENSRRILEARYLMRDAEGRAAETPAGLFGRVAQAVARAESAYGESPDEVARLFYRMIASLEFLPNSPTLMNAGRDMGQLSACFVLPVEDSMEAIFETLKSAALIQRTGGGTGFSFSRLRPKDDRVSTTNGKASGPVSFMRVFNAATDAIHQGGVRRGANMAMLRVDHPDVLEFIDAKSDPRELENFNVSVAATDAFMKAVREGTDYELVNPRSKKSAGRLDARAVFDRIVERAWGSGEPGLVFIDRVNAVNPTPQLGAMESTNPCAELPLLAYESCNLGSVNVARFLGPTNSGPKGIDWERLKETIHLAVRFLDDVIDANRYPLPQIEAITKSNRKIGLGVMGFADLLVRMGVRYDSDAGIAVADELAGFVQREARAASEALARTRGPFPAWAGSLWATRGEKPLRNATVTTVAPTGTISLIAGCSSGIEPLFALSYVRRALDGEALLPVVHPELERVARERGFWSEELAAEVARSGGIAHASGVPADMRDVFRTAHDIAPEWHVRMQAAFQRHVENAVSKTINLPRDAKPEDVKKAYLLADELGCKGITVYRDGSREAQVLNLPGGDAPAPPAPHAEKRKPRPRPEVIHGLTVKRRTGEGNLYVTINEDDAGEPFELFATLGKAGGCGGAFTEAIARLVSLALRAGVDVDEVRKQLRGISCHLPAWNEGGKVLSCPDAVGQAIEVWQQTKGRGVPAPPADLPVRGACPECGGPVEHAEGCTLCTACGFTLCT